MEYGKVAGIDKPVSRMVFGTDRLRSRRLSWLPDWGPSMRPIHSWTGHSSYGHSSSDATHSTRRAYVGTANGHSAWIRKRQNRDKVVVISKGCHPTAREGGGSLSSDVWHDLHASLTALGTDVIDLFLLHYDHPKCASPTGHGTTQPPHRRRQDNRDWRIQLCHERIDDANAVAAGDGRKPSCASSVQFSVADWTRSPWPGAVKLEGERQCAARDWYSTNGLSVFAWSRLARGFFSNHNDPQNTDHNPVSRWCATYFGAEENNQRRERALMFARDHDVTVAQVALAYVLSHPLSVFAVVGCTTHDNLVHDAGSSSLKLDEETLRWLATGRNSQ